MVAAIFAGASEVAHSYDRPPPRETLVISLAKDADPTTPQQVRNSLICMKKCIGYYLSL